MKYKLMIDDIVVLEVSTVGEVQSVQIQTSTGNFSNTFEEGFILKEKEKIRRRERKSNADIRTMRKSLFERS